MGVLLSNSGGLRGSHGCNSACPQLCNLVIHDPPVCGNTYCEGGEDHAGCPADCPVPQPADRAPIAVAGGPYSGIVGQAIVFRGDGSSDPDGDNTIKDFAWHLGEPGNSVYQHGPFAIYQYSNEGHYWVTLKVTDDRGVSSDTAYAAVDIGPGEIGTESKDFYTSAELRPDYARGSMTGLASITLLPPLSLHGRGMLRARVLQPDGTLFDSGDPLGTPPGTPLDSPWKQDFAGQDGQWQLDVDYYYYSNDPNVPPIVKDHKHAEWTYGGSYGRPYVTGDTDFYTFQGRRSPLGPPNEGTYTVHPLPTPSQAASCQWEVEFGRLHIESVDPTTCEATASGLATDPYDAIRVTVQGQTSDWFAVRVHEPRSVEFGRPVDTPREDGFDTALSSTVLDQFGSAVPDIYSYLQVGAFFDHWPDGSFGWDDLSASGDLHSDDGSFEDEYWAYDCLYE